MTLILCAAEIKGISIIIWLINNFAKVFSKFLEHQHLIDRILSGVSLRLEEEGIWIWQPGKVYVKPSKY